MREDIPTIDPERLLANTEFVRRLAYRLAKDRTDADDLAQQTWLAGLLRAPRGLREPKAWLTTVARNLAHTLDRRNRQRREIEQATAQRESLPAGDRLVEEMEVHSRVVKAVLALKEPYRSTVILRFFHDLSPAAIARREQAPTDTVRTRLKRALTMLRSRLADDLGGGERCSLLLLAYGRLPVAGKVSLATLGGIVMTTGTKLAIATAIVLAASLGTWRVMHDNHRATAPDPTNDTAQHRMEHTEPSRSAVATAPTSASTLDARGAPKGSALAIGGVVLANIGTTGEDKSQNQPVPFSGASVTVVSANLSPEELGATTSDEGGRFLLASLAGGPCDVVVRATAYPVWAKRFMLAESLTDLVIVLTPGGWVLGTVRNQSGAPLPNVDISNVPDAKQLPYSSNTLSAPDGSFRIAVHAGSAEMSADGGFRGSTTETVHVSPGTGASWNPVLRQGLVVRGHVLDPADQPVPQLSVQLVQPSYSCGVGTDAKGYFEIPYCHDEPGALIVRSQIPTMKKSPLAFVEDVRPDAEPIVVRLASTSASMRGTLRHADVSPVAQAQLKLFPGLQGQVVGWTTTTGDMGEFLFTDLPAGRYRLARGDGSPIGTYMVDRDESIDVGVVALPALGFLSLKELPSGMVEDSLHGSGVPALQSFDVYRSVDGDLVPVEAWQEEQSGKALPDAGQLSLMPGTYFVRMTTTSRVVQSVRIESVDVRAGETVKVGPSDCVWQTIGIIANDRPVVDYGLAISTSGGKTVARLEWMTTATQLRVGLMPGSFRVNAWSSDGRRGAANLTLEAGSADPEKVEIELRW